jgi:hypothetical protein
MVRLEFIKGHGGVESIINGNLRDTVRGEVQDIEDADRVIVSMYSAIGINQSIKAFEISGYVIVFDTLDSMNTYLAQIDLLDGELFNPGVNGIKKPDWDTASRDKTEGIQSHTYVDTDVEQDLIEGN